jgi:LPXTG-motif cell wall-anchored protein
MEPEQPADVSNEDQPNPPIAPSNRLFLIIAGIIAGLMLLTIAGMALYAMVLLPRQRSAEATQIAMIDTQNTEAAISAEQTIQAMMWTQTPSVTPIPDTETPTLAPTLTNTPVVVSEEETEAIATAEALTATVQAELTAAVDDETPTSPPSTPTTTEPSTHTPTVEPPTLTSTHTYTLEPPTQTPTLESPTPTSTQAVLELTPTITPQPLTLTPTSTPSVLPETGSNELSDFPLIVLLIIGLLVVIVFARKLRLT